MGSRTGKRWTRTLLTLLILGVLALAGGAPTGVQARGQNPGILPPQSHPHGHTYGEWAAEWWKWAVSIPLAENPILDQTGEFAHIDPSGHVGFLAGTFGQTVERHVTVPTGMAMFFPLINSLWWAPDDLETAALVAEALGYDPATLTDEELIRLVANAQVGSDPELTLTIDGVEVQNLSSYRAESPAFRIFNTALLDDLGAPISQPNLAVASGYWIMLAPLPPGTHEVHFTAHTETIFGEFSLDVTYVLNVVPRGRL